MVKIQAHYQGQKHCQAIHEPSSSKLETDAPKDNQGLGEAFSPTDLVATALGTCILTTVAIFAEKDGVDTKGATADIEKHMVTNPRRVGELVVRLKFPKSVPVEYREKIQTYALNCPVAKSLHPELKQSITIEYV